MMPSAIEKEILIEAPIEVVWHLLTAPDQIRQWFADKAEIELRVGSKGALAFKGQDSYQLQVEAVEPPRRFAFRWVRRPGLIFRNDNSLFVEFILEPENGNTRLRVVESGFDAIDWSDEERAKYVEDHANGWQQCLGRLRDLARTKPAGRE
jgi:uncharacterized protein YndB with AHSA1/START domain